MKKITKNELNFKTIISNKDKQRAFQEALFAKGIKWVSNDTKIGFFENLVLFEVKDGKINNFSPDGKPYKTFNDAMKLIEQVEPEQPKFFEFDIDKNGYFIDNRAKNKGCKCQCYIAMDDYYFAGIKYKNVDGWHMDRNMVQDGGVVPYYHDSEGEVEKAIPKRIRFINPEYKGEV